MSTPEELAKARAEVMWSELNLMRLAGVSEKAIAQREAELSARIEEMNRADKR